MQRRYALRDDQSKRIRELLPGQKGQTGVTARENRLFVEAVCGSVYSRPWHRRQITNTPCCEFELSYRIRFLGARSVFEIALWTGQQGRTLVWVNEQPHSISAINARGLKRNRPAGSGVLSSYKSKLNCGFDDAAPADELPFWTRLPGVLLF
jgi:hypothetical protein